MADKSDTKTKDKVTSKPTTAPPQPQKPSTPVPTPKPPATTTTPVQVKEPPHPQPEAPKTATLSSLYSELQSLKQKLIDQGLQITELQEAVARKRKPVASNGKVQIRDTKTGKVYPSKNATYKTLLEQGTLSELVKQGIFGDDPQHNTFGWYALNRALPDRFIEVKPEDKK